MKFISVFMILIVFGISKAEFIRYDNGVPDASYTDEEFVDWEESAIFDPGDRCYVIKIGIYFSGSEPAKDTIFITGSPFDFPYAVSGFAWEMAQIAEPIYFDYPGQPGLYEFDYSEDPIYIGSNNYLVLQHKIKSNGPYFVIDSDGYDHHMSLLCDVQEPNPNFYNIKGTLFYEPEGDYVGWIEVEYERYPSYVKTQPYPPQFFYNDLDSSRLRNACYGYTQYEKVSVTDWNGDGYDDITFGLVHAQNKGDGTFFNVNSKIGIRAQGTVWADFNNDGYQDCYAIRNQAFGHDQLLFQNSIGEFLDQTSENFRIDNPSVAPLFLDYDKDGLLDIFVAYGGELKNNQLVFFPDRLYKNLGNGDFRNVSDESGISAGVPFPHFYCGSASLCDYNNDNSPDIFIANDLHGPDKLFRNNNDGTFLEVGRQTGVIGNPTTKPDSFGNGRGSDWGDFDNDGYYDLAVGNMARPDERANVSNPSLLFKNNGEPDFSFRDVQLEKNLNYYEENSGIVWLDFNQDGYLDLCHSNFSQNLRYESVNRFTRLYMNLGPDNNYELKDVSGMLGINIHGAFSPVRLDYDWDGDMDLLIASRQESAKLYRNDYPWKGNWITFRLKGNPEEKVNLQGYGSTVILRTKDKEYKKYLPGSIITAGCSQNTDELHFGLNDADSIHQVEVIFSNGESFIYDSLLINRKYILHYGDSVEAMRLTAPQQLAPINTRVQCKANIKLDWSDVGGADTYHLQIAGDYVFDHIVLNEIEIKESHYIPESLNMNQWYYWRVKSVAEDEASPWSSIWRFHVDRPANLAKKPRLYDLMTYPNPANDISNIEFQMQSYNRINLTLFDSEGNIVAKLLDDHLQPGKYSFTIATDKMTSGTYYYVLENGEERKTEKIIITK